MMTLAQAHALLPASRLVGDPGAWITRVHSDSRSVQPGDLFIALRGERFDGHAFLPAVRDAGAAGALAEQGLEEAGLPGLEVPDTLAALRQLAGAWRQRMQLPLAAVTGSNGKTTVTQMVAAMLRAWLGNAALATQGNLNNHIGLPLTLLKLRHDDTTRHCAAVVELGMNHPGEVALLARLALPSVAVVNNAQREHQEFLDGVEAVARENGSVIDALGLDGVVVIPVDDTYTPLWRAMAGVRRVIDFGFDAAAAVHGEATWRDGHWQLRLHTPLGGADARLAMAGRHHAKNALAAVATALALGAPLATCVEGLAAFKAVKGRSALRSITLQGREVTLVDDSYNANPDSVAAAISVLGELPPPRWLVLGDMGEVGTQGPAFHTEAGTGALDGGIEHAWFVGPLGAHAAQAFGPTARHFASVPELLAALPAAPAAESVLVKGSRFMAMERVVAALEGSRHAA